MQYSLVSKAGDKPVFLTQRYVFLWTAWTLWNGAARQWPTKHDRGTKKRTLSMCWRNAPFWTGGSSLVQQSASSWFWVGRELTSQVEFITKSSAACRNNCKHLLQWGFGDCGFLAKISRPQLETCNLAKILHHPWLLMQDAWFLFSREFR